MDKTFSSLTVMFEVPFWIGVFEKYEGGELFVSKVTFGAEPKDYEVYKFILNYYYDLQYSPAVAAEIKKTEKNPKKMQRKITKELGNVRIGTKSQQALKLQQEQNKQVRKLKKRMQRLAETERMFELKQQKKKEKHRGR